MEITLLQTISPQLLETFLHSSNSEKSRMSVLASAQTGNDRTVTTERIRYILQSPDHLMFLAIDEGSLVGMILGQRVTGINNSYLYIHDVVVDSKTRGRGVGSELMQVLMNEGQKKWPEIVRMQLTSRPERGTGPFFQKFGFRPRTKESGDETIVYVKDIGGYHS